MQNFGLPKQKRVHMYNIFIHSVSCQKLSVMYENRNQTFCILSCIVLTSLVHVLVTVRVRR